MPIKVGENLPYSLATLEWLDRDGRHPSPEEIDTAGTPFILHFWSRSCPSCHGNMPHLHKLRDDFAAHGIRIYAVHRPMNESDLNIEEVRRAITELEVTEPCAVDNDHATGDALGVDGWPTYFLFDAEGRLRRHAKGIFGVRMIEQALLRLFDEPTRATDDERRVVVGV